eukprot:1158904-Pelagomonas_calceolata.AAC.7
MLHNHEGEQTDQWLYQAAALWPKAGPSVLVCRASTQCTHNVALTLAGKIEEGNCYQLLSPDNQNARRMSATR